MEPKMEVKFSLMPWMDSRRGSITMGNFSFLALTPATRSIVLRGTLVLVSRNWSGGKL